MNGPYALVCELQIKNIYQKHKIETKMTVDGKRWCDNVILTKKV